MPTCYKTEGYPYIRYDGDNEDEVLQLILRFKEHCHIRDKDEKTLCLLCPYLIIKVGYYIVIDDVLGDYTVKVHTPEYFATNFETREP